MSSINPNNIDGTYPIAGQDNDSQGFRDNFTNIKNNLNFAKTEIQDLQNYAIVTRPLTGANYGLNNIGLNELNNSQLKGVQCLRFTETMVDLGSQGGTVVASWAQAHYQLLATTSAVSLQFTGWPPSGFHTKLTVQITVLSAAHTLTLPSEVSENLDNIQGADGQEITFPAAGVYEFEFSTYDGGATITIVDTRNNYQTVTGDFDVTGDTAVGKNLYVAGNLTVAGTVTAIQSSTLDVADKNITVARGAIDNASADGAGITVDGASATILYTSTTDTFNFNKGVVANTFTGNLTGNVTGNLTGNSSGTHTGPVVGNITGDVTGNVTGNTAGTHTGPVVGDVVGNVTGDLTTTGIIKMVPKAFSSLPLAATARAGARAIINDSTGPTWLGIVVGGGSLIVPVYSDGINWRWG